MPPEQGPSGRPSMARAVEAVLPEEEGGRGRPSVARAARMVWAANRFRLAARDAKRGQLFALADTDARDQMERERLRRVESAANAWLAGKRGGYGEMMQAGHALQRDEGRSDLEQLSLRRERVKMAALLAHRKRSAHWGRQVDEALKSYEWEIKEHDKVRFLFAEAEAAREAAEAELARQEETEEERAEREAAGGRHEEGYWGGIDQGHHGHAFPGGGTAIQGAGRSMSSLTASSMMTIQSGQSERPVQLNKFEEAVSDFGRSKDSLLTFRQEKSNASLLSAASAKTNAVLTEIGADMVRRYNTLREQELRACMHSLGVLERFERRIDPTDPDSDDDGHKQLRWKHGSSTKVSKAEVASRRAGQGERGFTAETPSNQSFTRLVPIVSNGGAADPHDGAGPHADAQEPVHRAGPRLTRPLSCHYRPMFRLYASDYSLLFAPGAQRASPRHGGPQQAETPMDKNSAEASRPSVALLLTPRSAPARSAQQRGQEQVVSPVRGSWVGAAVEATSQQGRLKILTPPRASGAGLGVIGTNR